MSTEASIYTAVYWGADIINLSLGGFCGTFCHWYLGYTGEDQVADAIGEALRHHVTVIAAAGNEHTQLDHRASGLFAYNPHYIPQHNHNALNNAIYICNAMAQ